MANALGLNTGYTTGPRTYTVREAQLGVRWVRNLVEVKPLRLIHDRQPLPFLYGTAGETGGNGGATRPTSGQVWPRGSRA